MLVAGDMGPTGLSLPPLGNATPEQIFDVYHEQAVALAAAGADLLVLETLYDRREAIAGIRAARETGLGVLVFMTFEKRARGFFTLMGDPSTPTLAALDEEGADGVGVNCGLTSSCMIDIIALAAAQGIPRLMAQPNAGQPRAVADGGVVYEADPGRFAGDVAGMLRSGLRVAGGCCGTTPEFIRAVRSNLEASA